MSRLKLIVLVLIITLLGMVFIQNRELLELKLLCPERTQSCWYQTRQLPLAIWMGLFALGGVIISLLGQILNRYRYSGLTKVREVREESFPRDNNKKWFARNHSTDDDYVDSTSQINDSVIREQYSSSSYEIPQEPQRVERSGSTYSYKYREAKDKPDNIDSSSNSYSEPKDRFPRQDTKIESDNQSRINLDKDQGDDEDWI